MKIICFLLTYSFFPLFIQSLMDVFLWTRKQKEKRSDFTFSTETAQGGIGKLAQTLEKPSCHLESRADTFV